jgi:arabinofuranosyltransferase
MPYEPIPTAAPPRAGNRRPLLVAVLLVVSVVLVRTAWIDDDAYITFRTVDNFLHGYGLRWNVVERVQTYTNPLWMFVMTAAAALTKDVYYTSLAVSIALSLAVVGLIVVRVAVSMPAAILAVSVLLLSKSFVEYSTSGLENPLTNFLLVAFVLAWTFPGDSRRRVFRLTLIAALLMVNRLDTVLLVMPALAVAIWPDGPRRHWRSVVLGFAPLVAWELFSLIYYGFLFPNTAYAKLGSGIPASELVRQGLLYLLDSLNNDPLTLPVILVAVASPMLLAYDWTLPIGIAAYVVYVVGIGGDFMSGRFFAAPLLLSILHLVRRPMIRTQPMWLAGLALVWLIGLMAPRPAILSDARYGTDIDPLRILAPTGIMDERRWYYPQTGLLTVRPGVSMPSHKWLYMGYDLVQSGRRLFVTDAAGFIGYAAGPTVHLIDWNALGDPLLARLPSDTPWRVGHYRRPPPDGFLVTLESGRNLIRDGAVAAYYEKLRVVTQSPVWSAGRLRAIVAMNLGHDDGGLTAYRRIRVRLADVSVLKADGTDWNENGNVVMGLRGVEVALPQSTKASRVEVSVSGNDTYDVVFLNGGHQVGQQRIVQTLTPGGHLQKHRVAAPDASFDTIRLEPSGGDSRYSVGHIAVS